MHLFLVYKMYECMYYLSTIAKYSNLFQVPIDGARVVNVCMYVCILSVVCIICVSTWPDILSTVNEKVWILDPVDGTKGFMRGQHFCVALALVDRGLPRLSTMGCPNLNLYRVLQGESYDDRNIDYVDPFLLSADGGNILQPNPVHTYIHTLCTYNFLLRPPLP